MGHNEGWLFPKVGETPFKVIDDPKLIEKKNKMREALRDEYTRRHYNPYRHAAGVGGTPFDPAYVRYNAMQRTQTQFFRPGFRTVTFTLFGMILPYYAYVCFEESLRKDFIYKCRTGQIAYADRRGKRVL